MQRTTSLPDLTNRAAQQGGFLPRKIQRKWKKYLSTYHLIRKTIYLIKNSPNWQAHPIIEELKNHSPHPTSSQPITELTRMDQYPNSNRQNRTYKCPQNYHKIHPRMRQKAIFKYRLLYGKSPKKINKIAFKNQKTPSLDCITDEHNNIVTNPIDIANEIHNQQSISNRPTVQTCYHQPEHIPNCTCGVRQYPWHDLDGYVIEKKNPQIPLHEYFNKETYDICLKNLANNKTLSPDKIPNIILRDMSESYHKILFSLFSHCYKQKQIPTS